MQRRPPAPAVAWITASSWRDSASTVGRGSSSREESPQPTRSKRITRWVRATLLVERALPQVVPLLLEVADPARPEDERRALAVGRVGEPPALELEEADVLVHVEPSVVARTGHAAKMARRADAPGHGRAASLGSCTRKRIRGITIRPLRNGESSVVQAVFDRLGPTSRLLRFGGAKNVLTASDLEQLSRVDGDHHVLVAVVAGEPVGIARLVRDGAEAEVAIAVADEWQHRGVGTFLADRLAADARAAGIERLRATMHAENRASMALMWRMARGLKTRCVSGQLEVVGRAA